LFAGAAHDGKHDPPFNAFLTTTLGGIGMGLSIRSIIALHGATFHLSPPVAPASLLRNIALNSSPSAW